MNKHFSAGAKSALPACLGVIPVGISVGLLAVQAGLKITEAVFMSVMVMAGSSELMAISMITKEAAFSAIIIGTFFINLRHLVMSSSLMRRVKKTNLAMRLVAAFALCDESFAVFSMSDDDSYPFVMGANTALYLSFVSSTAVGCFMTGFLPQVVIDSFGIAFYAAFFGLLIPSIKHNSRMIALVLMTALLNFLLQLILPSSWSVILSMMLGAFAGVFFTEDKV